MRMFRFSRLLVMRCDSRLAKVNSGQIEHRWPIGKKPDRTGKSCIYFFKPARDRNDRAKGERHVRTASHPERLT
jgi:hypothetical protein